MLQVGKGWIDGFDCVPDAVLAGFRDRGGFQEELIAVHVHILQIGAFFLDLG